MAKSHIQQEKSEEFEDGSCQECGEPLNNAEGDYCFECLCARSGN